MLVLHRRSQAWGIRGGQTMWFKMLTHIIGPLAKVSDYFAIDRVKITWQKILVPIIVFAAALLIFFVLQLVLQVAFKLFKKMRGSK